MKSIHQLWPGHVLHTMVAEHDILLGVLNRLLKVNSNIQALQTADASPPELATLVGLTQRLLDAEPHHQREEQVLFPELEKCGIDGPPAVMIQEHEELRICKQDLHALALEAGSLTWLELKTRLDAAVNNVVGMLRDHIERENTILYPLALQEIDEADWDLLKVACDEVGYCSFTPGVR